MYKIKIYSEKNGKEPFTDWIEKLPKTDRAKIKTRLDRIKLGNFGDCKNLGDGISELRFNFSSGFRIYFTIIDNVIVLLLNGGNKSLQNKDIEKAKIYKQNCIKNRRNQYKKL